MEAQRVVRATSLRRCHQHLGRSSVMSYGHTDNLVVIRAGVAESKLEDHDRALAETPIY